MSSSGFRALNHEIEEDDEAEKDVANPPVVDLELEKGFVVVGEEADSHCYDQLACIETFLHMRIV